MCDPITGIMAALSIGSGVMNYMGQQSAMKKQEQANREWVAWQRQQSQEAWARDQANRGQAEEARQKTLIDLSAGSQKAQQISEEARLQGELTPGILKQGEEAIAGDMLLSGQKGAAPELQGAIGNQVTQAARDARQRIAALSAIQSYGGGEFGLQNTVNNALQTGNQAIDLTGNYRRGDLAAYNVAKQVEPRRFQMTSSPLGGIASGLSSIAGRGMGASFGFGGGGGGMA